MSGGEKRNSRLAPQSLSEEFSNFAGVFKRKSNVPPTEAAGDVYAVKSAESGSSSQPSSSPADEKSAELAQPRAAHVQAGALPAHQQGMQAPNAGPTYQDDEELAQHRTISKVPGNNTYYEKDGLRTYGDGENHDVEEPMTPRKFMIFVAMAFLWCGSQIPLYLFGGIIPYIELDVGGADRYVWIALGNLIPLAVVTPFVGALSDLFGRKNIAMFSALLGIVGSVVCSTSHSMNVFVGGQTLIGIGAGIGELTALAVAGESAPTKKRGIYVGSIIITIVPYCPSVLYAQLISNHYTWRWLGLWCGLWNFIALILTFAFYWPPPRPNSNGLTKMQIAKRLDYVGAILSAGGLTLFLAGLTWAGDQYPWNDNHVKVCIALGAVLCILFFVWEIWLVKYPMFPGRLKKNPRALYVICFITFVSGANFFAVLLFWPTQFYVMYTGDTPYPDPITVGVGSLPVGFCIIGGSIIFSIAVSILKGRIRILMVVACIIMAAGNGSMAAASLTNLGGIYAAVTFANLGVGAVIVPNQIIASIICPDDLIATITALTIAVRVVGGTIGYAAYYHVLRNRFIDAIFKYLAPVVIDVGVISPAEFGEIAEALSGNLRSRIPEFPGVNTPEKAERIIHASRLCFEYAYREVYFVSIAFGAAAIIAAFFLPDISKLMDSHVAVQYQVTRRRSTRH